MCAYSSVAVSTLVTMKMCGLVWRTWVHLQVCSAPNSLSSNSVIWKATNTFEAKRWLSLCLISCPTIHSSLHCGHRLKAEEMVRTETAAAPFCLSGWYVYPCVLGAEVLPDDSRVELSSVQVNHREGGWSETFTKACQRSPESLHVWGGEAVGSVGEKSPGCGWLSTSAKLQRVWIITEVSHFGNTIPLNITPHCHSLGGN